MTTDAPPGAVALLPEPLQVDDEAVRAAAEAVRTAGGSGRRRAAWRRDADFAPRDREAADDAPTLRA